MKSGLPPEALTPVLVTVASFLLEAVKLKASVEQVSDAAALLIVNVVEPLTV